MEQLFNIPSRDQFPPECYGDRKNPKFGEVTKEGLIVGTGDKKRVIPADDVYKLAVIGANNTEICEFFGIDENTLKYNFRGLILKGRAELKTKLRKAQIETAMKGNAALLIFLGKNYLGQADQPMNSGEKQPLPWNSDQDEIELPDADNDDDDSNVDIDPDSADSKVDNGE